VFRILPSSSKNSKKTHYFRVADPDPYPDSIRSVDPDPDPDPGGQKLPKKSRKKFKHFFES
jgi:hypothetical protein